MYSTKDNKKNGGAGIRLITADEWITGKLLQPNRQFIDVKFEGQDSLRKMLQEARENTGYVYEAFTVHVEGAFLDGASLIVPKTAIIELYSPVEFNQLGLTRLGSVQITSCFEMIYCGAPIGKIGFVNENQVILNIHNQIKLIRYVDVTSQLLKICNRRVSWPVFNAVFLSIVNSLGLAMEITWETGGFEITKAGKDGSVRDPQLREDLKDFYQMAFGEQPIRPFSANQILD